MKINGLIALVTGGTDGIGLEIARQLKAGGASVIVAARRPALLDQARGEGFEAIEADLSSPAGCAALVARIGDRPIALLINNAGTSGNFGPDDALDLALTDRAIFLNLNAPIHLTGLLIDRLKAQPRAMIVNVTSGLAIAPRGGGPVYCASKAGLRSFTMALRYNLRTTSVRVLEILPPIVETAMTGERGKGAMTPQACARQVLLAIAHDRAEANVGQTRLLRLVYSISPAFARRIMLRY
jgi:uncharacterized oxidoreductase